MSGLVGYVIGRGTDDDGGGGTAVATQPETAGETTGAGTTAGAETTAGETTTGETTGGETTETGGDGGGEADAEEGRSVFASAGCGNCHTLEAAGASGTIGPNLDESQPSLDRALEMVRNGGNGMPAFEGQLSDEEIEAVAGFVSGAAGG